MRNSERLIQAIGNIDDEIIDRVGREFAREEASISPGRSTAKIRRILLLAAAIAALLTATAYAAGWFGLRTRVIPPETAEPQSQVSTGGISRNAYADTPEGRAFMEWAQFHSAYLAENHDFSNENDVSWLNGDGELEKYYYMYGAFDQTMMDKLLEIRDKYGITLHTDCVVPPNNSYFFQITGLEPFLLSEGGSDDMLYQMVYEDGSFEAEIVTAMKGVDTSVYLARGRKGTLDPSYRDVEDINSFEEWQYTTQTGAVVNLAVRPGGGRAFVFYDDEAYIVTLFSSVPEGENYRADTEALAELVDYKAVCGGKTDLSLVIDTTPTSVKPKEGLLTLADWVETAEYQASSRFQRCYNDYVMSLPENAEAYVQGFSFMYYRGCFPVGVEPVDSELREIQEQYALQMPVNCETIWFGRRVSPEKISPAGGLLVGREGYEALEVVDEQEIYKLAGVEPFAREGTANCVVAYDNGAFWMDLYFNHSGYYVHYIPKGCFYPAFHYVLHPDCRGWAYDTACGEQVYITLDGVMEYPVYPSNYILYETDTAYVIIQIEDGMNEAYRLELVADDIDFTKFQ